MRIEGVIPNKWVEEIVYFSPVQVGNARYQHLLYYQTDVYYRQYPEGKVEKLKTMTDLLRQVELGIYPFDEKFKQAHFETVMNHNRMGLAYLDMRQPGLTLKMLEKGLECTTSSIYESQARFGFLRIIMLNLLACAYRRLKQYDKATSSLKKAVEITENYVGEDVGGKAFDGRPGVHPLLKVFTWTNYCSVCTDQQLYDEGLKYGLRTLALVYQVLPKTALPAKAAAYISALCYHNAALAALARQSLEDAIELSEKGVDIVTGHLHPKRPGDVDGDEILKRRLITIGSRAKAIPEQFWTQAVNCMAGYLDTATHWDVSIWDFGYCEVLEMIRVLQRTKTLKHISMDQPFRKTETLDHVTTLVFVNAMFSCKPLELITVCKIDFDPTRVHHRIKKKTFLETSWYQGAATFPATMPLQQRPAIAAYKGICKGVDSFGQKLVIFLTILGNHCDGVDFSSNALDSRGIRALVAALRCRHRPRVSRSVNALVVADNQIDVAAAGVLATLWFPVLPGAGLRNATTPTPHTVDISDLLGADLMGGGGAVDPAAEKAAAQQRRQEEFEASLPPVVFRDDEVAKFRTVFEKFDADKSGSIEMLEIRQVLLFLGHEATAETVRDLQKALNKPDDDDDDGLQWDEFLELMKIHKRKEILAFKVGFDKYDADGSGTIDAGEMKELLSHLGFYPSNAMVLLVNQQIADIRASQGKPIAKSKNVSSEGRQRYSRFQESEADESYAPEDFLGVEIGFDEFLSLMEFYTDMCAAEARAREAMQALGSMGVDIDTAFAAFNQDGDSKTLTVAEFKHGLEAVMTTLQIPFSLEENEWAALVNKLDDDWSGAISLDEFKNFIENTGLDMQMDDVAKFTDAFSADGKGFFDTAPTVLHLDVSNNAMMGDAGLAALCGGICQFSSFETLRAANVGIGPEGVRSVLVLQPQLVNLSLSHNTIGSQGLITLCTGMIEESSGSQRPRYPFFQRLELDTCNLTEESMSALANLVPLQTNLKYLVLSNNSLSNGGIETLASGLGGSTLVELHLKAVGITSSAAVSALAERCESCNNLALIDLSDNIIVEKDAAVHVGELLADSPLHTLVLQRVGFGAAQVQWFIEGGATETEVLNRLLLNNNPLGDDGLTIISESMIISLQELHVSGCGVTSLSQDTMVNLVALAPSLRVLDLSDNEVGTHLGPLVTWLASYQDHHSLRTLNLNNVGLGDEGFAGLAPVMSVLQELYCSRNNIGSQGLETLLKLDSFILLKALDLSHNKVTEQGVHFLMDRFQQEQKRSLWNPNQRSSNIGKLVLAGNDLTPGAARSANAYAKIHLPLLQMIW